METSSTENEKKRFIEICERLYNYTRHSSNLCYLTYCKCGLQEARRAFLDFKRNVSKTDELLDKTPAPKS